MTKQVTVIVEGREYHVTVGDLGERPVKATVNQQTYHVQVPAPAAAPAQPAAAAPRPAAPLPAPAAPSPAAAPAAAGSAISAPMPGDIVEVNVSPGDSVNVGDVVCVLEAMKMRNLIRTSRAGVIASVGVTAGQAVDYGAVLVTFE